MSRTWNDQVLYDGPMALIVAEVDESKAGPVVGYLTDLGSRKPKDLAKIRALLDRVAQVGPQNIRNKEKVRHLGDGLYEFKAFQVRIFWMYGTGQGTKRTVVLLDAVTKKQDRHRPRDIQRARRLMTRREQKGTS